MRNDILDFIKRELIGPDPVSPHTQKNGEEILLNEPPRLRYGAGVLFPSPGAEGRGAIYGEADSTSEIEEEIIKDNEIPELESSEVINENLSSADVGDDFEEEIGLANNYLPSAMGFSSFSRIPSKGFLIKVTAGIYEINNHVYTKESGEEVSRKAYFRSSLDQEFTLSPADIPTTTGNAFEIVLKNKDQVPSGLILNIRNRTHGTHEDKDVHLLTFTLINRKTGNKDNIKNEDCFFQVSFSVTADEPCFMPYKMAVSKTDKEDEKSNQLLYRKKRSFAVGHGCSPEWPDEDINAVNNITTRVIPSYEIKPIVPNELKNVALKMADMSDMNDSDITVNLIRLNTEYENWINEQEKNASSTLQGEFLTTAVRHIENCRHCLKRMKDGVELLKYDTQVNRAFRLMNRAMLMQQLHYSIELRNWSADSKSNYTVLDDVRIPDIKDQSTWPANLGSWRPFQIAFILINLNSMLNPEHPDRRMVDLIWFPTGGGKTEAYLGLSAFTIFLKRLKDNNDSGTTVLMRYTLRLLTAQQFQRAAALICACEYIRTGLTDELGDHKITIGLWVGEITPNKRSDATSKLKAMSRGGGSGNSFVILKCPWCGAAMGAVKDSKKNEIKGYKQRKVSGHESVTFNCDNEKCDFSKPGLPLCVIDEDIYDNPPTLLIGTVDKFAMLTWKPEARTLFGFNDNGARLTPPELIIQDELHLISGPLGSMVGLYETMIEELCTKDNIKPKIIASSATISRAKEQINSLYGRGIENVNIFPAQCLDAGNSFFAYEERDPEKVPGRLYVGIFASALPSHATAQVRLLSALLQSIKLIPVSEEKNRDPYWTILAYFNSIRELGHAATMIRADITEYLNSIYIRKKIKGNARRFINADRELTSRIDGSQVTEILEELLLEYPKEKYPVDICLATNMVSVGVDIPRLGLMTVVGQPKTTSEYIQATSRVGRSRKGPGLVFAVYNCSKPRDRSHFEHFQEYHSKIYSKVEPTSVTPFSPPARERALHAILVGLIRFYSEQNRERPTPFPTEEAITLATNIISKRVSEIDPEEKQKTLEMLERRLAQWKRYLPVNYGSFGSDENIPLMYQAGNNPPESTKLRAWSTPTTMRNVDATCDAIVINDYINIDN